MSTRIRPANVLDLLPLSRPPRTELRLDLVEELLTPHRPGRGLLPWQRPAVHTLLSWGVGGLLACVQARTNRGNYAWDVGYLGAWAPDPSGTDGLWAELLAALGVAAGRQGTMRLLARLPVEERVELFRQVGFAPFAEEILLLWDGAAQTPANPLDELRPLQPGDLWAVQRLHVALTPPIVQQAEGGYTSAPQPGEEAWTWQEGADIRAYLRRQRGPRGTRLGLLLDPAARQQAQAVLAHGLAGAQPPVYLVLRSYQGELLEVARRLGFRPYAEQVLLVKHLAVAEKQRQAVPARPAERPLGAAPTTPSVGKAYVETNE